MKRILIAALLLLMALPAAAAKKKPAGKPLTEEQKTIYAIGLVFARQLEIFDLTPSELNLVKRGLDDATKGREPLVDFAAYSKKSKELASARRDEHGKKLLPKVPAFMAAEAAKAGAVKTESGLIFQSVRAGDGAQAAPSDRIKVNYRSTLIDGKEMASTYKVGKPEEFFVNEAMKCLSEAVQLMKQGGRARLICPPDLALGKEGSGVIPADATLVYDVELVEVKK
ncbi:FKBP-type peptidyl-prolyl cis-trans isomerase [Geobacter sp. OR-1]|uniref:FKBP-type peptidyl-prolyl cis-trans isomerase n=1 Tax=Geobacter sp. OR-1 TaxID=1266765 RepID=UPI0005A8C3F8|nr:FKBP-type peptidyl-prolyl cis-trans isomerase [Geobacter sp. OR-1]